MKSIIHHAKNICLGLHSVLQCTISAFELLLMFTYLTFFSRDASAERGYEIACLLLCGVVIKAPLKKVVSWGLTKEQQH